MLGNGQVVPDGQLVLGKMVVTVGQVPVGEGLVLDEQVVVSLRVTVIVEQVLVGDGQVALVTQDELSVLAVEGVTETVTVTVTVL